MRKIGEGSNACVYLVREVLGEHPRRAALRRMDDEPETIFGRLEMDSDTPAFVQPRQPVKYGREFAIKVLSKRDLSPGQIGTQLQEAQIHQSLPYHPNIVTLHRTLITDSWLLLILEHVPGEDLFYFLEQARDSDVHPSMLSPSPSSSVSEHTLHRGSLTGPISHTPRTPSLLSSHSPASLLSPQRLRLIARMFTQMCAAVAFCHAHGIAHRDIKPENFIVTEGEAEDGERRVMVKLTDFGLASRDRESKDVDCGSAPYMSYECANNVAPTYATHPADVWSLGIVLINMLYHQNPWPRATISDPDAPDLEDGEGEAFEAFQRGGAGFFMERFPGVSLNMAQYLVDRVFCPAADRVDASQLGAWVLDLGGMVDEVSLERERGRKRKTAKVGKSKSKSRVGRRDQAVGRDEDERERERRGSRASGTRVEHVHHSHDHHREHDRDRDRDHDRESPSSSREPSLMKRRKRGARSNKSKNSAANSVASLPLPLPASVPGGAGGVGASQLAGALVLAQQQQADCQLALQQSHPSHQPHPSHQSHPQMQEQDREALQLQEHASAVEALAREASLVSGPLVLSRRSVGEDSLPLPLPLPLSLPPGSFPSATDPLPGNASPGSAGTLRPRPSMEADIWARGRQPPPPPALPTLPLPLPLSAGSASRPAQSWRAHHSPLNPAHYPAHSFPNPYPNPGPQPNPNYASSVSSFTPSTGSYNTRLSNGSLRSLSTVATTMSDPTSVKSRWSGLREASIRSVGSAESPAAGAGAGPGPPCVNGDKAKGKGKERERERDRDSNRDRDRERDRPSPLNSSKSRVPRTNVKSIQGLPPELDDLRTPASFMFTRPTPAQRIVHESKRAMPWKGGAGNGAVGGAVGVPLGGGVGVGVGGGGGGGVGTASGIKLDPIVEASRVEKERIATATGPIFEQRDASTSTTSLSLSNYVCPVTALASATPGWTIGTVYEDRERERERERQWATPGRAKQGQILTLGKILRGLGNREPREVREARA
ncbi:kinase-like protein [Dacryopinax primogenitus]|uniref:Kinase-like protein n=1 Tax=Dacryopinax primogenitus (strain DJM 731) TaxID=1858805 RepID=M5FNG8_DACPD|nr:kinase-like protein [Dacryopinax primogenitus]EJT97420.1 kinase-like protein [Dacryopinax primogenitus]